MEEENFDFSIEKALKKVYSGGDTRMDTQALVAIDQIENLIKVRFLFDRVDFPEWKRASCSLQIARVLRTRVPSD